MAAPAFRAAGSAVYTADSVATPTALSPTKSGSTVTGDLMLCVTESIKIDAACATPTGWVLLTGFPVTSATASGGRIYVFARIADGGANDAPSVSWSSLTTGTSGSSCGARILSFSDALIEQGGTVPAATDTAATTSFTMPSITTTAAFCLVVGIALRVNDTAHTFTITNHTERTDDHTTTGTGHGTEVSTQIVVDAGASTSGTVTPSNATSSRVLAVPVSLNWAGVSITDQSGAGHTGWSDNVTTGQTKPTEPAADYVTQIQAFTGDSLIFDECWDQVPQSASPRARVRTTYSPFTDSAIRSFGVWVNRDAVNTTTDMIFSSGGDAGGLAAGLFGDLQLQGTGGLDVLFTPRIISATAVTWTAAFPGDGQWVFIGLVYNQSTAAASLYINGELISTQTVGGTTTWGGTAPNYITWGGIGSQNSSIDGKLYGAFVVEGDVTDAQWLALTGDQVGRPTSDIATTGWTTAPLYSKLDEITPDDGDLVTGIAT